MEIRRLSILSYILTTVFFISYGSWTLYMFKLMIDVDLDCAKNLDFSIMRGLYYTIMIVGALPALVTIMTIIFLACIVPVYFINLLKAYI